MVAAKFPEKSKQTEKPVMTLPEYAVVTRFAEFAGTEVESLTISPILILEKSPSRAMRAFQAEASKHCAVLNVQKRELQMPEQSGEVTVMRSFTRITGIAVSTR